MTTLHKVYKFRLCPNKAQAAQLVALAGSRRFIFNWALARRKEHYAATGKTLSLAKLGLELTILKQQEQTKWLKDSDSQLLQQAVQDVDRSFKNFFEKRASFPCFKSKHRDPLTFRIPQRVTANGNRLYVPKVGHVKFRKSQDIDGQTKSATFKRGADGHWYVTLVAEFEMPDVALPPVQEDRVVGIDLGLKDFIVLSDGTRLKAPRFFRKGEQKLAKAQRQLSRCKKGSKRYGKARLRVARIYQHVANQRADFIHKTTYGLIRDYQGFCIENLSVKGLAKTKLSKSILDAAFGEFRRQLEYKSVWNRKRLAVVGRFFPSSKLCGTCGTVNQKLTLSDRLWTCGCGAIHDRDLNAACNIKKEGLVQIPTVATVLPIKTAPNRGLGRCLGPSTAPDGLGRVAVGHSETLNARGDCVRLAKASSGR
jgi:putative transposase